jgi:hypothetical protein
MERTQGFEAKNSTSYTRHLATSTVESNTISSSSRMATFDFEKYLSNIDPKSKYTICALSGGRVNLTVRAIKAPRVDINAGRFPGHETIVLKYAPAFIAKDGQGAPFSTFRQVSVRSHTFSLPMSKALIWLAKTIEARALGLFATPAGELTSLCDKWDIKIPQLLHHDSNEHVIIMTDLGDLESLTEHLKCMTPLNGKAHEEQQEYKELGTRLGGFMADLHSPNTFQKLGDKRENYFENPVVHGVIHHNMIVPIFRRLTDFNIPFSEILYNRIEQDHIRPHEHWEQNFRLGDLWTGSVLLDWPKLCVIDWEFAGLGRSVNGDMATLFAQFHLHLLESRVGSSAEASLRTLIKSTAENYRRQLASMPSPICGKGVFSLQNTAATDFPIELVSAIRSAFITHG